jgi:hypothetical protein
MTLISGTKKNKQTNNFNIGATDFGVQVFKIPRFVTEMYEIGGLTGFLCNTKSLRGVSKVYP